MTHILIIDDSPTEVHVFKNKAEIDSISAVLITESWLRDYDKE